MDQPDFKEKLREEILTLSKDLDTFLNDVEGCEDEKYSPEKNSQLIIQLREKDSRLQKARFLLVQRDNLIDVNFSYSCIISRTTISGDTIYSMSSRLLTITSSC